eukprot:s1150_g23.t1
MDLHSKVPPERWCVTYKDFYKFVHEIKRLWSRGLIDEHDLNPHHHDPNYGPNLYQVNEQYVKPVTLKAGGMSYALMKHPEGLPCDVFISHAWAEGIFELATLVGQGWPRGHGLYNMYLCLLANPQNSVGSWLEGTRLMETSFALALRRSSHVLVIPNKSISIYSRLWCVYEAYLGTEFQKTCMMPTKPRTSVLLKAAMPTMIIPCLLGITIGACVALLPMKMMKDLQETMPEHILACMSFCCILTMLSALTHAVTSMCARTCRLWTRMVGLRLVHSLLVLFDSALIIPWYRIPLTGLSHWDAFLHRFIPLAILTFNSCLLVQLNQYSLETKELALHAAYLDFQTLDDATCTSSADEIRIREAISGHEEDVDTAIRVLMKAGAYNLELRRAYEDGEDITASGTRDICIKTFLVAVLWMMSTLDTSGAAEVQQGCPNHHWAKWLWIAAAISAMTTATLPLLIWRLQTTGPQRALHAVKAWLCMAMMVVGIPLTLQIENHLLKGMHFLHLHRHPMTMETMRCPSEGTLMMLVVFRPCLALIAVASALIGPWKLRSRLRSVGSFVTENTMNTMTMTAVRTNGSSSGSESTATESQSESQ